MQDLTDKQDRIERPPRVLLLVTSRSYRTGAFAEAAENLGIEVVKAFDMEQALAQYWRVPLGLDYSNIGSAVNAIVEYAEHTPLGAIISVDDSATLIAAEASKKLGLPHNSPESALAARDKHIMREKLAEAGIQAPRSVLHHLPAPDDQDALSKLAATADYPCVLKPVVLSGSRGVIRANNPQEFIVAASRLWKVLHNHDPNAKSRSFLVERFIPGREVALEGVLTAGNLQVFALFDKPDPLDGPYFEETIYVTPSRLPPGTQNSIAEHTAAAAAALGLEEGPVHAELRLNEKGPWIIEIAGRSIGGLCSQTLRFSYQATLEELILRQAFGQRIEEFKRQEESVGVMMIPIPEAGLLKRIDGCEEALKVPLVESIEFTAQINSLLTPLPEGDSYLGFIFARGGEPAAVEAALRKAHSKLQFDIAPQLAMVIR